MTNYLCWSDRPASVVYLLHFDRRISDRHTCQHYLGFARIANFARRIEAHRTGRGARLTQVAHERGIGFTLARVWYGDRTFERRLKRRKEGPRLCPLCTGRSRLNEVDELNHLFDLAEPSTPTIILVHAAGAWDCVDV